MIRVESECVGCGLPCLYGACPYYKVKRLYCDDCGEDMEHLYRFAGYELCVDCVLKQLERIDYDDDEE